MEQEQGCASLEGCCWQLHGNKKVREKLIDIVIDAQVKSTVPYKLFLLA